MTPFRNRFVAIWLVLVVATMTAATISLMTGPAYGQAAESAGNAEESNEPDPIAEFELLPLGPVALNNALRFGCDGKDAEGHKTGCIVDMSINKAVIYLWLAALICCLFTVLVARRMQLKPNKTQTFTEVVYEFAHDSIAKATLGEKTFSRYMPYVASLFMFLWVVNLISFIPLPFGHESAWGIADFGLYAATSNINVTLALTLVTFFVSHFEGVRHNGLIKYMGSWKPHGVNPILGGFIWVIEFISQLLRLVSMSVRLFANMLAGHLLILMMLSLIAIIGSVFIAIGTVPIAVFFFLFEFGLVATLQAFIFAMLSGIYIGGAAEPQH